MWHVLIISLPGASSALRMRLWRALKAQGAGILRDGVYVLPHVDGAREAFEAQAAEVLAGGGTAFVLAYEDQRYAQAFESLFDRAADYDAWLTEVTSFRESLAGLDEPQARREADALRRGYAAIAQIDFFAGDAQARAATALADIDRALNSRFSPDEPTATSQQLTVRDANQYQGRRWATRENLWVDRVASAWLIKRFIDKQARFVWFDSSSGPPRDAIGFDFDGAEFTHVDTLVTFEVLLHSFGLDTDAALHKVGTLVRYLDIGGAPIPEAAGLLALLAGAKQSEQGDDRFFASAQGLFDHLYSAFDVKSGPGATR